MLLFVAVSVALVAPAWVDEQPRIIGGGELGGWLWRHWWMKLELVAIGQLYPDAPLLRFLHTVSLGRYPETGNITDLLLLSVPLDQLFGHPHHYNIKVLLILLTNALAGYAFAFHLSRRVGVSCLAALTFACNVFVVYEFQGSGLRQSLLCFLPLFCLALERLFLRPGRREVGWVGVTFAATAIFYWFYGLFAAVFAALRFGALLLERRGRLSRALWAGVGGSVLVAAVLILPFAMPYLSSAAQDRTAQRLPEVTWLENFPSLERLQSAPLRPETPYDNLLASLARVLYSSWAPDWAFNPLQSRPVPLVMGVFAVGLGFLRYRRTGFWLFMFVLFYIMTWGPYLRINEEFVLLAGEYSIRLPYWYAFKFVPMMSRLFAPYRMAAMVVLAMMVLLTLNLASISARLERQPFQRFGLGLLFFALYFGQLAADPLRWLGEGSNRLLPLNASQVNVPHWYYRLAKLPGRIGIVELPLERQQDLLNYYQTVHGKKVMGGWASPGALPPVLRAHPPPSRVAALLQWLSRPDGLHGNALVLALQQLGSNPYELKSFPEGALEAVHGFGYRYLILHELGCFSLEPRWGRELYERIKLQLEQALGPPLEELVELEPTTDEEALEPFRHGLPWVPSIYSVLLIPEPRPLPLRMAVFGLKEGVLPPQLDARGEVLGTPTPVPPSPTPEREVLEGIEDSASDILPPTPSPTPEREVLEGIEDSASDILPPTSSPTLVPPMPTPPPTPPPPPPTPSSTPRPTPTSTPRPTPTSTPPPTPTPTPSPTPTPESNDALERLLRRDLKK